MQPPRRLTEFFFCISSSAQGGSFPLGKWSFILLHYTLKIAVFIQPGHTPHTDLEARPISLLTLHTDTSSLNSIAGCGTNNHERTLCFDLGAVHFLHG